MKRKKQYGFITGLLARTKIEGVLWRQSIAKGLPLLINEFLWSLGVTMQVQCYSTRGLEVVAGLNICNTLNNVFNIAFIAMGNAVAIIIGQMLGAGKMKEARDVDTKLIFFSTAMCVVIGGVLALVAPIFPRFYNTTPPSCSSWQCSSSGCWLLLCRSNLLQMRVTLHCAQEDGRESRLCLTAYICGVS